MKHESSNKKKFDLWQAQFKIVLIRRIGLIRLIEIKDYWQ